MGCSVYKSYEDVAPGQVETSVVPDAAARWLPKQVESATSDATPPSSPDASTPPTASLVPFIQKKQLLPVSPASADLDAGPDPEPDVAARADAAIPAADAAVIDAGSTPPADPTGAAAKSCTRARLQKDATRYLEALASGDERQLELHPSVRYTENGKLEALGLGLWLNRPRTEFARHALDEASCSSVTEAVLRERAGRVVLGLRLRYLEEQLFEVEAQVVRSNDAYWAPDEIIVSGTDAWVEPVPDKQRSSAAELTRVAMGYFGSTIDASLLPPHADGCKRRQNGALMPNQGSCGRPGTQRFEQQRLPMVDEITGIATAVIKYNDFIGMYLFKVSAGTIQNIEVLGGASSATTGW